MSKMKEITYCEHCGAIISNIENSDYFSHISIRYCPDCAKKTEREKTATRVAALRRRKKIKDKFRDEQLVLLQQQNELLQNRNITSLVYCIDNIQVI